MIARIISWLTEARGGGTGPARSTDVTAHDAFARAAEADRQMRLLQEIRVADRFNRDEAIHWHQVAVALSAGSGVHALDLEDLRRWKEQRAG
jgi:hypothetical protein